jgi:hypothetical protein
MKRVWLTLTMCSAVLAIVSTAVALAQTPPGIIGTWHGTLSSRNYDPVQVTLVINQGVGVKLTGAVTLVSPCLKDVDLEITVNDGSNLVLAGTDPEGDTLTFRGTLDATGTQLTVTYILNASASARCETDDGSGTLKKNGTTPQQ